MGFALPVLLPQVGARSWEEIARFRRMSGMRRLRAILRELEVDALDAARSTQSLSTAVASGYTKRLQAAATEVDGAGLTIMNGLGQIVVGTVLGVCTTSLGLVGAAFGAAPGIAATAWDVRELRERKKERAWIGVMTALQG